jgi:hypothetical protein
MTGGPGLGYTFTFLRDMVVWLGSASIAVSVFAAFACGIGVRFLGARRWLTKVVGIFALTVAGFFISSGLLLTVLEPTAGSLLTLRGLPWTTAFLLIPMAGIAVSAHRCLIAA